jgi:hypothetical protein
VNAADFDQLDEAEKKHFHRCERCGEMVDRRQLDDVLFHQDHVHRPDIPYAGSERLDKPTQDSQRVARRFGKTYHISYLRKKLERLRARDPEPIGSYEEWLISAAQKRANKPPGQAKLQDVSNEQLIVALLLLENIDRPGLFETAALLLSRVSVNKKKLARLAKRERVDFLLSEIRQ